MLPICVYLFIFSIEHFLFKLVFDPLWVKLKWKIDMGIYFPLTTKGLRERLGFQCQTFQCETVKIDKHTHAYRSAL
jgi:hypothetical protein